MKKKNRIIGKWEGQVYEIVLDYEFAGSFLYYVHLYIDGHINVRVGFIQSCGSGISCWNDNRDSNEFGKLIKVDKLDKGKLLKKLHNGAKWILDQHLY